MLLYFFWFLIVYLPKKNGNSKMIQAWRLSLNALRYKLLKLLYLLLFEMLRLLPDIWTASSPSCFNSSISLMTIFLPDVPCTPLNYSCLLIVIIVIIITVKFFYFVCRATVIRISIFLSLPHPEELQVHSCFRACWIFAHLATSTLFFFLLALHNVHDTEDDEQLLRETFTLEARDLPLKEPEMMATLFSNRATGLILTFLRRF